MRALVYVLELCRESIVDMSWVVSWEYVLYLCRGTKLYVLRLFRDILLDMSWVVCLGNMSDIYVVV